MNQKDIYVKNMPLGEARERGQTLLRNGRDKVESLLPDSEGRRLLQRVVDGFVEKMV